MWFHLVGNVIYKRVDFLLAVKPRSYQSWQSCQRQQIGEPSRVSGRVGCRVRPAAYSARLADQLGTQIIAARIIAATPARSGGATKRDRSVAFVSVKRAHIWLTAAIGDIVRPAAAA